MEAFNPRSGDSSLSRPLQAGNDVNSADTQSGDQAENTLYGNTNLSANHFVQETADNSYKKAEAVTAESDVAEPVAGTTSDFLLTVSDADCSRKAEDSAKGPELGAEPAAVAQEGKVQSVDEDNAKQRDRPTIQLELVKVQSCNQVEGTPSCKTGVPTSDLVEKFQAAPDSDISEKVNQNVTDQGVGAKLTATCQKVYEKEQAELRELQQKETLELEKQENAHVALIQQLENCMQEVKDTQCQQQDEQQKSQGVRQQLESEQMQTQRLRQDLMQLQQETKQKVEGLQRQLEKEQQETKEVVHVLEQKLLKMAKQHKQLKNAGKQKLKDSKSQLQDEQQKVVHLQPDKNDLDLPATSVTGAGGKGQDGQARDFARVKAQLNLGQGEGIALRKRTVIVTDIPRNTSKKQLELYFKAEKHSQGGDITNIDFNEEEMRAEITYADPKVAERVANFKDHKINKVPVKVSPDASVGASGSGQGMGAGGWSISGDDRGSSFGGGDAGATSFGNAQIPITTEHCMKVTAIEEGKLLSEDFIQLFFDDEVRDVEAVCCGESGNHTMLVYFKNAQALRKALAKEVYDIDEKGFLVTVSKSESCSPQPMPVAATEPSARRNKDTVVTGVPVVMHHSIGAQSTRKPLTLMVSLMDKAIANYVNDSNELNEFLVSRDCSLQKADQTGLTLLLHYMPASLHWPSECLEDQLDGIVSSIQAFLSNFSSFTLAIPNEVYGSIERDALPKLAKKYLGTSGKWYVTDDDFGGLKQLTTVGKADVVKCFKEHLYTLTKKTEDVEADRMRRLQVEEANKMHQITKRLDIDRMEIALLEASAYEKSVSRRYPNLEIVLDSSGSVNLSGHCESVYGALTDLYGLLRKIKKAEYSAPSPLVAECFQEPWFRAAVQQKLSKAGVCAVLEVPRSSTLIVWCSDEPAIQPVVRILKDAVAEFSFSITPEARAMMNLDFWRASLLSIANDFAKLSFDKNSLVWTMACLSDSLTKVQAAAESFVSIHTPITKTVSTDPGRVRFVMSYCKNEIERLEKQHDGSDDRLALKITASTSASFVVKGSAKDVASTAILLHSLLQQVQKQNKCIQVAPGGTDCLKEQMLIVERKTHTVIELCNNQPDTVSDMAGTAWHGSVEAGQHQRTPHLQHTLDDTAAGFLPLDDGTVRTPQHLHFQIINGLLSEQKVDVLVNSVDPSLDLNHGAVSQSLLKAAGRGLQEEIRWYYPRGISTNAIAITAGHSLDCTLVFHVALEKYDGAPSEKALHDVIMLCLHHAQDRHMTSIAFPAIGSGALEYPLELVAVLFHKAVATFSALCPHTSLKRVMCIMYDSRGWNAFKATTSKWLLPYDRPPNSSLPSSSKKPGRGREIEDVNNTGTLEKVANASSDQRLVTGVRHEVAFDNLRLQVVFGDIAEERADIIVNSTDGELSLKGEVSRALLKKGGEEIKKACRKATGMGIRSPFSNKVFISTPGKLECHQLMHLDVAGASTWTDYEKLITAALNHAEKHGAKSMSVPAIGGDAAANALVGAIAKFCTSRASRNLQLVRIVLVDEAVLTVFYSAIHETLEAKKGNVVFRWLTAAAGMIFSSGSQPSKAEVLRDIHDSRRISIYGSNDSDIASAHFELQNVLDKSVIYAEIKPLHSDDINLLLDSQMEEIKRHGDANLVQVTFIKAKCCIGIQGYNKDSFQNIQGYINEYLQKAARKRSDEQADSDVLQRVRWQFKDTNGSWKTFDPSVNRIIEKAYYGKRKKAELCEDGYQTVDFDTMKLSCRGVSIHMLRRLDMLKFYDYPPEWTLEEDLQEIPLVPTDAEYQKVESEFMENVGTSGQQVLEIKRFQDPLLWRQYLAQKGRIERSSSCKEVGLERNLWHGTASDIIDKILKGKAGFNRSLTGAAALYGKGVYFARDASFAAQPQYAVPDANGYKHIIFARVLTGEYIKGNPDMRVPPYKGVSSTLTYDTTVDDVKAPSIFVVYHDAQAYPMYIIKFC